MGEKETTRRSLAKTITYRIICVVMLLLVSWFVTHNLYETLGITIIFQAIQTVLYYLHERAWAKYGGL